MRNARLTFPDFVLPDCYAAGSGCDERGETPV
jgi:hypothetical protein